MAEQTHQQHIVNADSIYINNKDDRKSSHIQIGTAGVLGDNDLVLNNCNVDIISGGYVKAPEIRTAVIKDTAGNTTITLSSTAIDFHSKTINNFDFSSGSISASSVSSANGYASLDAELDALTTNKVSITGHTASKVFVSTGGGGITTSSVSTTDLNKLSGIEANADVTDTANVTSAGALMDSELTDLAGVKGVTISTLQVQPSEGAFANGDKTKLDAIEANATADQTNAEIRALVESATDSNVFTDADHSKLNGIEASADVTDTANVTSAGALMDSELTDLAGVKGVTISTLQVQPSEGAFANGDKTKLDNCLQYGTTTPLDDVIVGGGQGSYATDFKFRGNGLVGGATIYHATMQLPNVLGADITLTLPGATGSLQLEPSEGAFANGDKTKLDAIEANADVTDTANVTSAGALMDSELTDLAGVKGVTISTLQVQPSEGAFANGDKTKLDAIEANATADQTNAEIRTAVGNATDSNVFTDALLTKLNTIESSARADQTDAEIRTAVENASDSNVFTDADHTKLNHITCTQAVNLDTMESNIATNNAKTGITSGQSSAITANTAKTGITSGQASAIVTNTAKPTMSKYNYTGSSFNFNVGLFSTSQTSGVVYYSTNFMFNPLATRLQLGSTTAVCTCHISTSSVVYTTGGAGYWYNGGHGAGYASGANRNLALKAEGTIWFSGNSGIHVTSDRRVKQNIVEVDDKIALKQLRAIEVKSYDYIDKEQGEGTTIGFISQQVKEVLPMAVQTHGDYLPDEMREVPNVIFTPFETTDKDDKPVTKYKFAVDGLTGNKYKFKMKSGNIVDSIESEKDEDGKFTCDKQFDNVFVYGKWADDFHILSKSKLWTINFSATQQIDKNQQAMLERIATLEKQVQQLLEKVG